MPKAVVFQNGPQHTKKKFNLNKTLIEIIAF